MSYISTTEVIRVTMDDLETVNLRLPEEIIKLLDDLVTRGLFANRSEAIREFAREYVLENTKLKNQDPTFETQNLRPMTKNRGDTA